MGFRITLNLINALLIISTFSFGLSFAKDTITSAQFIRDTDSETVTSNSSDFRLGFFSPHNSTHRYVGIWYLSETNIVWVANRDQPLKDSSGIFRISQDGNLVVLNGQNLLLWSSNVSNNATTNITAQLQDSGNLVLLDNTTGETVWQSFEHPCDAAVPKMKISANRFTGKKIQFVSWKTPSDPSSGYFTGTLERLDVPEVFFLVNGTQPYWRTGPWNGRVFIGSPQMSTGYLYGWTLVNQADGTVYLTYNFIDPASSGILSLNPQGRLKLVRFYKKKQTLSWVIEQTACDHYGTCGEFGSCNQQDSPICSCLTGFEPRNSEEWKRENWTSGCVRKSALMCERSKNGSQVSEEDGFLKFQNMKVPDFAERSDADTEGQCGTECLGNCSCLAYAYDPGIGCMYWSRELIDIQKFSNGGVDLYIRLVHSELGDHSGKSKDKKAIIAITVSIGTIILAASAYLVFCTYRSRRKWTSQHRGNQSQKVIEGNKQVKLDELPLYDFEVLAAATNNFNLANMLGKGGFGRVYKGTLPDDQEIAVKRLSRTSGQGLEEFMNEVLVISKLQHRNLVRLLGCCVEGDEKMLIYEFMPNKSLDAFLFDQHQRKLLDWTKRFNIIEGIARGLLYLHRDSRLRIIHRDLKASNILLDGEMNPKISDFGLARIFGASEDEVNTNRVVGTYGYMSPEYAMKGLFSEKSDVYSFGVLLLEIISGRRNSSFFKDEETLSLLGYAWKLWNEEKVASLVDAEIWDPSNERQILKCIHMGLLCVQEAAKERPSMTNVVMMLISENVYLPPPKQVAFVHKQSLSSSESSNSKEAQRNSLNNVTLTDIEGR